MTSELAALGVLKKAKTIRLLILNLLVGGATFSAAAGQQHQYLDSIYYMAQSTEALCQLTFDACFERNNLDLKMVDFCNKEQETVQSVLEKKLDRKLPWDFCQRQMEYESKWAFEDRWVTEVFNIDLLRITTMTDVKDSSCSQGGIHQLIVEGQISPDSSFAVDRLLNRLPPCADESGKILFPVMVALRSGGGLLNDGFKLGETFRSKKVTTVIENGQGCASSCAVAFLGGTERVIYGDGKIMFHAPYFSGRNEYGERDVDCRVGGKTYEELLNFYVGMTDQDVGERLFERTLWYCSADDGWVVTGGAAAELFGIATQK